MGIVHSNLKDYFTELVAKVNDLISSPDPSIDAEMETKDDNNGDSSGDDDNQDDDHTETSNEDTVVDPSNASDTSEQLAEPPQALMECWLPESFRRRLLSKHTRVSGNDSGLLPEIDEIDLQRELEEEEELDARDLLASKNFEAGLWGS